MYPGLTYTLLRFVLLHIRMTALKPPLSCWDPLPHLRHYRGAVRSRLMSWRKSLNPLYSCLSTLQVIRVPHIHIGHAWQPQIHTLALANHSWPWVAKAYAARDVRGERAGSVINQMFGLHLPLALSLGDNTIYILIDAPVGFGWTRLCKAPAAWKPFQSPHFWKMLAGTVNAGFRQTFGRWP